MATTPAYPPLSEFLGKRFAARRLLQDKQYHASDTSIAKEAITEDKEPTIRPALAHYASLVVENPASILSDTYDLQERSRDWNRLLEKDVLKDGQILAIDARSRPGHKILDYHMPHFWDVTNHKGISVRSLMTQSHLEKALLTNLMMHSTPYPTEIRRMLVMTGGLGNVTKYRTVTAKAIVQHFGAKRVLDPCAGWGGRLLGTLSAATDTYYCGCEPDVNTSNGLMNILSDEAIPSNVSERAEIWNEPIERMLPAFQRGEPFDLVLTSPPYYNLELYTSGTQSTQTYPSWADWVDKWLKPLILGCLRCLKPTGTSCWSVKNFKSDKAYPLADLVKQIHKDAGWHLVKTVTMTGSARPGAQRISTEGKATRSSEEETFCFRRGT